jgi:hypothetical protein
MSILSREKTRNSKLLQSRHSLLTEGIKLVVGDTETFVIRRDRSRAPVYWNVTSELPVYPPGNTSVASPSANALRVLAMNIT